jgi:hypothetical protein
MAYRELPLKTEATLCIDGDDYDIDYFGMDDGHSEEPGDALRFLFQLGRGYYIHLYVIQAGWRGDHRGFFHTTWLKDCAVMEVEMEDTGAPSRVESDVIFLPLLYSSVAIEDRRYEILTQAFRASDGAIAMTFSFAGGALRWTRERRWELALEGAPARALDALPRFSV